MVERGKEMRILVITRFYLNGQTTHVLALCQELIRQNHEVFLVISRIDHPGYLLWLRQKSIPHSGTHEILNLLPRLQVFNPEVIHNHSAHTLHSALELGQLLGIPVVATSHYLDFEPSHLLDQTQTVIAISKEMGDQLLLENAPVVVIENGVPIPRVYPNRRRPKHAVFLARVTPRKQHNFQLTANSLKEHDWSISAVGNWRCPDVRFRGWQRDVFPELFSASLVIGTGRAIREGMASGCAGIVLGEFFDGIVTPECVKKLEYSNFSGRFSKTIPSSQDLQSLLDQLTPDYLEKLSSFGRAYAADHFSVQMMVTKLVNVYYRVRNERKNEADVKHYIGGRK